MTSIHYSKIILSLLLVRRNLPWPVIPVIPHSFSHYLYTSFYTRHGLPLVTSVSLSTDNTVDFPRGLGWISVWLSKNFLSPLKFLRLFIPSYSTEMKCLTSKHSSITVQEQWTFMKQNTGLGNNGQEALLSTSEERWSPQSLLLISALKIHDARSGCKHFWLRY